MRLDQLEQRLGDTISIEWKAFLLRPEPKTRDHADFVEYTRSWQRPAEMEPGADFRVWATDNRPPTSSLPPHVAAKAVRRVAPEADRDFHRRLVRAYFTENRTVSDWAVLLDVAEEVGVDPNDLAHTVDEHGPTLTETVVAEHNEAIANGISAVPTTVIAGVLPVPGAQDVSTFETWITRLVEHRRADVGGRKS